MSLSKEEFTQMICRVLAGYIQGMAEEYDIDLDEHAAEILILDPETGESQELQLGIGQIVREIMHPAVIYDGKLDS